MLLEHTTVLILDDDPEALGQSRAAIAHFVPEDRILCALSPMECLQMMNSSRVDLLFLDVEMPGTNGFALADYIHQVKPDMKYVFLTGHTELGAESYDYEPIGFLSKPIDMARLEKTLERYKAGAVSPMGRDLVAVDTGNAGFVLISPARIRYIAKEGRRTMIHCEGESHQVQYSMGALEAIFSDYDFFRIHQSIMVPLNRIAAVKQADFGTTYKAILDDGTALPVSRGSYARLRERLMVKGVRFM